MIESYVNVVRNLPLGSGIDLLWDRIKENKLDEVSIFVPKINLADEEAIKQTGARLIFALLLPTLAKVSGYINLGLGGVHLAYCVINFRSFKDPEKTAEGRQEFEKAFVRLTTGVYDFGVGYLLNSSILNTIIGRATIPVLLALAPTYVIQAHYRVIEKKETALAPTCLIMQLSKGLTDMVLPEPEPKVARWWALPTAFQNYAVLNWRQLATWWNTPKAPAVPKPAEKTL